jgi:hypothetical protein|eukprot:scaffold3469_cov211-Alexandrium_tamarense.AAC.5
MKAEASRHRARDNRQGKMLFILRRYCLCVASSVEEPEWKVEGMGGLEWSQLEYSVTMRKSNSKRKPKRNS